MALSLKLVGHEGFGKAFVGRRSAGGSLPNHGYVLWATVFWLSPDIHSNKILTFEIQVPLRLRAVCDLTEWTNEQMLGSPTRESSKKSREIVEEQSGILRMFTMYSVSNFG